MIYFEKVEVLLCLCLMSPPASLLLCIMQVVNRLKRDLVVDTVRNFTLSCDYSCPRKKY